MNQIEFRDKLRRTIDSMKPVNDQLKALSQYDNLTDKELGFLISDVKNGSAGTLIEYLGHERLKDHLPKLLTFLKDMNWPASGGAATVLIKSEHLITSEVKRVLNEEDDTIWHYWILCSLIRYLPDSVIKEMKTDLIRLVERADKEGAAVQALSILKENQLLSQGEIQERYLFLLKKFEGDSYWIDDLNYELFGPESDDADVDNSINK